VKIEAKEHINFLILTDAPPKLKDVTLEEAVKSSKNDKPKKKPFRYFSVD
jgi:hypothetical protein